MTVKLIGRDSETADISAFLSSLSGGAAALAITGDPGAGKTSVWKHVVETSGRPFRVLTSQPASAERPMAFSALDDLFADAVDEVLPGLPGPRRRALEAALLRDMTPGLAPRGSPGAGPSGTERRVLARGILDTIKALAGRAPLMVAVDDAQWLDRPSASVLEFCVRRLQSEPVTIVVTSRTTDPLPLGLDRALPPDRLSRMQLGPLTLGAIAEILRSRFGATLPRYTLTRLYDACGGNPFYALESARALLSRSSLPRTNEPIPIPENLSDLVREHVRQLAPEVCRVGQLMAASPDPRERLIRAAGGEQESWAAIDQAAEAGLIERDGERLRFTHPLLRCVLYAEMTPSRRRHVHQQLAAATPDLEGRAWHLALGADRPSEHIAEMLDRAASQASARGAPEAAASLEEQATRLTPASRSGAAAERTVRAADYHFRAGEIGHSQELVESVLPACPPGPPRTSLLLRLATIHYHQSGWPLAEQTFRLAAEQAHGDFSLRARAEQGISFARLMAGDLVAALQAANVSLDAAERAGDQRLVADSLARVASFKFLRSDRGWPPLLDKAEQLDASAGDEPAGRVSLFRPMLVRGLILKWCDRLDEARLRLVGQYRHVLDRGDEASLPFVLYHLSQLECWAGNWDAAEEYALEGCRVAEETHQQPMRPATLYALALVRGHLGQVDRAHELADEALALCGQTGNIPLTSQLVAMLGFLGLSLGDHQTTNTHLGGLAATAAAVGLGEPSVVKFLPDQIEALAALGELRHAWSFTRQLEARGKALRRPWALATGARCRAHLAAADGDLQGARAASEQALSYHDQLPMPFELGRTLLIKGIIERRAIQKPAARASLGQALSIFEHLGAPLWASKARRELDKIIMCPAANGLTRTERRVAALVAQGRTNKEVAAAMFVTENTVQTHIRHIFQKLGVRSRTELAAKLLSAPADDRHEAPQRIRTDLEGSPRLFANEP